jgi:hypothetical protein
MGEVAFDELNSFFKGDVGCRRQDYVKMIRHDHENVKMEARFHALLLEYVEHQQGIGFDLKKTSSVCGRRGDEVSAEVLRGPVHVGIIAECLG